MLKKSICTIFLTLFVVAAMIAQPPLRPPQGQPKHDDGGSWIRPHDTNRNDHLEQEELKAAIDRTFLEIDTDKNDMLDVAEIQKLPRQRDGQGPPMRGEGPPPMRGDGPPPMRPDGPPPGGKPGEGRRPGENAMALLPPFFFDEIVRQEKAVSKADFAALVRAKFKEMDKDQDGKIGHPEARTLAPANRPRPGDQPPPNAKFIGAELSFGDRLVTGQPFSAETVIEQTRRLFDGSTVKKELTGAIYRDSAGRTRREQPIDNVAGVNLTSQDAKPIRLIFINDFPGKVQYSFDSASKVARRSPIWNDRFPFPQVDEQRGSIAVPTGTRNIEGVTCEMTRTERTIPAGTVGNPEPLKSVSERCFSQELQLVIMSMNSDPIGGNHVFRLKNIKRAEPSAELFSVPSGFKIENTNPR